MSFLVLPPNAPKPTVNEAFYDDPLFHNNPKLFELYRCLHGAPKEIYMIIYHHCFCDLSPGQLKSIHRNAEFSAILYSIFRRVYLPHFAKGLAGAELSVFMKDVASSEELYLRPAPLRFQPEFRVYTFCNIVQLDVTIADASDFPIVQPIQYMLLLDLTFRYPPNAGNHIIPLLLSWHPETSGLRVLRKLRLVASEYGFHSYDHQPRDIYWDHPAFARALGLFSSLSVLAFVHPAYLVPIKDPIWWNDCDDEGLEDTDGVADEDDDEEGTEGDNDEINSADWESMEADNEEGIENDEKDLDPSTKDGIGENVPFNENDSRTHIHAYAQRDCEEEKENVEDPDECLHQARRGVRFEQEACFGPNRRRFYLKEADWQSGEQSLVTEWASPSLSAIFLVYAHDERSQVLGDFSLEQDVVNGRFSHWTRDSSGQWLRHRNDFYMRQRGHGGRQNSVDLKLSGMEFADDCWSYGNNGTITISSAQAREMCI